MFFLELTAPPEIYTFLHTLPLLRASRFDARVDALIRRGAARGEAEPTGLRHADLELDLLSRKVTRSGRPILLQQREFQMLEYLMRHAGRVVTRTMLLEGVWNYHFDPQTNVIDVHISRLRQKVDKDFDVPLIHTVRGSGYMLAAEDRKSTRLNSS